MLLIEKNSLQNEAEASRIIAKAEAEANKRLQGQGIANQRRELQKVW
jgi:hypothetical protein